MNAIKKLLNVILGALSRLSFKQLLCFALLFQTAVFAVVAYRSSDKWLRDDNTFYETPAWNLASGHGLSFSRNEWEDPYLTDLFHKQHPESVNNEYVPATTLPIGYSIFIAAFYCVFGRNLSAVIFAHLFLLNITIVSYFYIAKRALGERLEGKIALVLISLFPLWAFASAVVMSDILTMCCLAIFALIFFRSGNSYKLTVLAGLFLGLAVIVRPYAMLLPVFLLFAGWVFNCAAFNLKKCAIVAAFCGVFLGGWMIRNYYQFGQPMLTSMNLGYVIWIGTQKEYLTDDLVDTKLQEKYKSLGIKEPYTVAEHKKFTELAISNIEADPFRWLTLQIVNTPRLWISTGGSGFPLAAKMVLIFYLSLILLFTLFGAWLSRRSSDPVIVGSIVMGIYYTLFFIPLGTEGRLVLPARCASFLLAAIGIAYLANRFLSVENVNLTGATSNTNDYYTV